MRRHAPWLVIVGACVQGPGDAKVSAPVALASFAERAQPVLAERCANPSCHGDDVRPLSLFAVHQHRMVAIDTYLDAPLTEDELLHNYLNARVFIEGADDPADALLLRKPLATGTGGVSHSGGTVFVDTREYGYRELRAWVSRALDESSAASQ